MEVLQGGGKSPFFEKALRWILLGGIVYGGMKLVNWVTPFVLESVGNLAALIGVAAIVLLAAMNYQTILLWYLGFCKKITRFIIAMDPLSVMNGYLIKLRKKIKNLRATYLYINGKKIELGRIIEDNQRKLKDATKDGLAARQQHEDEAASLAGTKALGYQESINIYTPIYDEYEKKTVFLDQLLRNWTNTASSLEFQIEIKTEQFTTIKAMFKGLKSIDELTSSGSAQAEAFGMSLKALEADMSQRLSYIDDFENRAKPLLTNMKVQDQAKQNDAMAFLDQASKDQNLILPDYKSFTPTLQAQDIDYQEVKSGGDSKYNF